MNILSICARLFLLAVFSVSACSKLFDVSGFRRTLAEFGTPRWAIRSSALSIPFAELMVAIGLVASSTARYAAIGALLLLAVFVTAISINIAHGRRPDCHCFGKLHSEPIGWRTLMRNLLFLATACLIAWPRPTGVGGNLLSWIPSLAKGQSFLVGAVLVLIILTGSQIWLSIQVWAQQGRLLLRLDSLESKLGVSRSLERPESSLAKPADGLPLGTKAPEFRLPDTLGNSLTLHSFLAKGKPVFLVFTDPNCVPCRSILPHISRWQKQLQPLFVIVTRGSIETNRQKATELLLSNVLIQQDRNVADAYHARATPAMVLIRPDGTIGSQVAIGEDAIFQLVERSVSPQAENHAFQRGDQLVDKPPLPYGALTARQIGIDDQLPVIELPDLDGAMVNLSSLTGLATLLLFWDPRCGYCSRMLEDLKKWERSEQDETLRLVVISTGDVTANRSLGLQSKVLLQSNFAVGRSFGVSGTPSAILVNTSGKIASKVFVGASHILNFARHVQTQSHSSPSEVVKDASRAL
jgi:peroxiredoxin